MKHTPFLPPHTRRSNSLLQNPEEDDDAPDTVLEYAQVYDVLGVATCKASERAEAVGSEELCALIRRVSRRKHPLPCPRSPLRCYCTFFAASPSCVVST